MSTQKETVEEVKTGVEQAANAGTPKKRRRGISNDTRSTSRLNFLLLTLKNRISVIILILSLLVSLMQIIFPVVLNTDSLRMISK